MILLSCSYHIAYMILIIIRYNKIEDLRAGSHRPLGSMIKTMVQSLLDEDLEQK